MSVTPYGKIPYPLYPLNNVTPFTYRDGITYLEQVEELRKYINEYADVFNTNNGIVTENVDVIREFTEDAVELLTTMTGNAEQAAQDVADIFLELQTNGPVLTVNGMHGIVELPAVLKDELVVNARDHDIVGDSVTNDAAAFEALVDTVADGSTIFLPAGTYNLAGISLSLAGKKLTISGQSREKVVLEGDGTADFLNANSSIEIRNVTFNNWLNVFNFDAATSVEKIIVSDCIFTDINGSVVRWNNAGGASVGTVIVSGNIVEDVRRTPITMSAAFDHVTISDNVINNVSNDTLGVFGLSIGSNILEDQVNHKNVTVTNNRISNVSTLGTQDVIGIFVAGVNAVIHGNYLNNMSNASGSNCEGIYTKVIRGIITDNILVNAGRDQGAINIKGGLRADGTSLGPKGYAVICANNHIKVDQYPNTCNGISIQTEDVIVRDNIIEGTSGDGIQVVGVRERRNIQIRDNIILNSIGTHGIWCRVPIESLIISGNIIDGLENSVSVAGIRVSCDTAWGAKHTQITNNIVRGLVSTNADSIAIWINGSSATGKLDGIIIEGNQLSDAERGILLAPAVCTNVSVINNNFRDLAVGASRYSGSCTNLILDNNQGYETKNSGVGVMLAGTDLLNIPHGLPLGTGVVPNAVVSPMADVGDGVRWWVSGVNSTGITIRTSDDVVADTSFRWFAEIPKTAAE